jgi:UDPglucose 6-dehydrogenase
MTITFIGHGYVGLVTATVFADLGNKVHVIGHTPEKIENLKKGILPIYEPGLEEMVKRNVKAGRLLFTLDYLSSIPDSEVVFIAVGTPPKPTGEADLSVVYQVAEEVGKHLEGYTVVITKSTVPVGTSEKVCEILSKVKKGTAKFDYASVPEFLREGQAISDTRHPDRVVIGTNAKRAEKLLVALHDPIITDGDNSVHLVLTNIPTAEMIKYASNAFLATKISFANAIAHLSEHVGANGPDVLEAIGLDKRIGRYFLNAGAGYGGSCFPKDVKALIAIADGHGYDFKLLKEVEAINKDSINGIVRKTKELLGDTLTGKKVGLLGLAFKPDTDDMRDAPAIIIARALLQSGATITAYDPIAIKNAKKIFSNDTGITFGTDAYAVCKDADVLLVVTEWNEFQQLDFEKIKKQMHALNLIDARNMYNPEKMKALGFTYRGVGR